VTLDQYQEAGVSRVSVGAGLAGFASRAATSAGKEMIEEGNFSW
jgi:2-methylisocitrate lyase-like PEP mutase family enzyme